MESSRPSSPVLFCSKNFATGSKRVYAPYDPEYEDDSQNVNQISTVEQCDRLILLIQKRRAQLLASQKAETKETKEESKQPVEQASTASQTPAEPVTASGRDSPAPAPSFTDEWATREPSDFDKQIIEERAQMVDEASLS